MGKGELVIPKTWRSELARLIVFGLACIASVVLSSKIPSSIVSGPLFSVGASTIYLRLPLFWFLPAIVLGSAIIRIYNVRYSMDSKGIESRVGIISLNQTITRIRFEDIRSIETEQTLFDRVLNVGLVEMGTAATSGLEMVFEGVASPKEVQRLIQSERDARQRMAQEREAAPGSNDNKLHREAQVA